MWNDPCRWTRARLPLMAGDDLIGADRRRARRHLIGCASCRHRLEALHASMGVLHAAAAHAPARAGAPPLWPELARQIRESRHPAPPSWGIPWGSLGAWSGLALASGLVVSAGLLLMPTAGPASGGRVGPDLATRPDPTPAPRIVPAPPALRVVPVMPKVAQLPTPAPRPKAAETKAETTQVAQNVTKPSVPAEPAPASSRRDEPAERIPAPQPEPTR